MRQFLPIILGADENAYACARMFYEINGQRSLVFCSKGLEQTSHSRILYRYVIEGFDTDGIFMAVMTTALPKLKKEFAKILLVPCSDYYAELVIRNSSTLSQYVDSPILPHRIYREFEDKIAFSELCQKHGIPHPKTEITLVSQLVSDERERSFPLVMKPANSNCREYLRYDTGKRKKVYFCDDALDLKRYSNELLLSGYSGAVVLQEFVFGGATSSRVVNAYCDKKGRVRLIGVGEPLIEYADDRFIGNYAAIRVAEDKTLCDMAADFLERIRYVGFANFDIKIDRNSGEYRFLELNPRQGRSSYFMRVGGANLMRAMYDDVVLEKQYSGREYVSGKGIWINEPIGVIKREMKRYGLDAESDLFLGETALDLRKDFSIPRAVILAKRRIASYFRQI